ncbi:hypothetical protein G4B88_016803 [Cannabis sativa]|uniref:HP domain-containing protein n=1 Tax=Cannabis sativa TaxID=3483 RepID=A0A7J6DKH2_CANSA|nr:hypothetical protein G4B88_016803 [Cannabis sativa]
MCLWTIFGNTKAAFYKLPKWKQDMQKKNKCFSFITDGGGCDAFRAPRNNCICYGVNAHNKDSLRQFLNFLQARVIELRKKDNSFRQYCYWLGFLVLVNQLLLTLCIKLGGQVQQRERERFKHVKESPQPGDKRYQQLKFCFASFTTVESESDLKGARSGKSEMSPLNLLNTSKQLLTLTLEIQYGCGLACGA